MVSAVIRPHALSPRDQRTIEYPEGSSLLDMVRANFPGAELHSQVLVFLNGNRVEREHWGRVWPKRGAMIHVALALAGGGDSKSILASIAMIAVAIVAWEFAPALAGYLGVSEAVAAGAITVVGSLVVGALFKPPGISLGTSHDPSESATYTLQGQQNQATPYGVVQRVYGTHRIFPKLAAVPFVASEGPNQFLYMLLDCGYGPLQIEQMEIGDTPIENFRDVQFDIHSAWKAGDPLSIYRSDVSYEQFNIALATGVPEVRVSAEDASYIALEFACPRGLVTFDDRGNRQPNFVQFSVLIRPAGSGAAWTPLSSLRVESSRQITTQLNLNSVQAIAQDTVQTIEETEWGGWGAVQHDGFAAGRNVLWIQISTLRDGTILSDVQAGDRMVIDGAEYLVTATAPHPAASWWKYATIDPPLPRDIVASQIDCPVIRPLTSEVRVTDSTAQPLFFSIGTYVAPGQWEVQVTRTSDVSTDTRSINDLNWIALRSAAARAPIALREAHTIIELKIRASDQLSGVLQNLNVIATAILPVWDTDGGGWSDQPTRNPAWAYLDVLRGRAALRPLADARIDFQSIFDWADYCDEQVDNGIDGEPEPRVRFDHVVDYATTTFQMLQSIAAAGRATPTIRDGRHGILVDEEQTVPVQLFTPRNSWGFNASRQYVTEPNGLRVKFVDPSSWQEGEVIEYAAGYNAQTAVTFEELKLLGVTRYTQATRDARYMKAQALLRREEFEIQCDIESLIATRGDLVAVQHDVLEVGGESSRVATVAGDTITLYDAFGALAYPSQRYGVRIRLADGTITDPIEVAPVGAASFRLSEVPDPAPAEGDLVAWGLLQIETGDYLVKAIAPGPDFTATLTLTEIARGIYDADTGVIPAYVPPAGARPTAGALPPPERLRATQLDRTVGREPFADVVLNWDIGAAAPYYKYRVARVDPSGVETLIAETFATSASVQTGVRLLDPGALDQVTRYAVVGIDITGRVSAGAFIDVQLRDPLYVPDPPQFLASNVQGKTTTLTWRAPTDESNPGNGQVAFFEVRWVPLGVAPVWGAASRVTELLPWNATAVTVPSRNGAYMVKALTASRVESDDAAVTVTAVEDLLITDIWKAKRFQPSWHGVFDQCEVDGSGRLQLTKQADGTYPPIGVFISKDREIFNQLLQCRVAAQLDAQGISSISFMADWTPLAIAVPIGGAKRGTDWDASIWINSSAEEPFFMSRWIPLSIAAPLDPVPAWSDADWRPLIFGEYTSRVLYFAVVLESLHPAMTPLVSMAGADIDFPEREEAYSDIAIPIGGLDFVFARQFVFPPAIAIDLQAAAVGDFVARGPVGTAGVHIDVKNGAASKAGVVDIRAYGVGRQL
jgi:hypothetical protein